MSAREWLQSGVIAWLEAQAALAELRVFDAPPVRGAVPFAVVEEPVLAAWDSAGVTGHEGRLVVSVTDEGERPLRLRALIGDIEDAMASLPVELGGGGWRVATLRLVRSRIVRAKDHRWVATSEFAVRVYRAN